MRINVVDDPESVFTDTPEGWVTPPIDEFAAEYLGLPKIPAYLSKILALSDPKIGWTRIDISRMNRSMATTAAIMRIKFLRSIGEEVTYLQRFPCWESKRPACFDKEAP